MGKKEVTVIFETITPLWTGNAWQGMTETEIRPSSLVGSLRFWFETIMYFAGILKEKDFDSKKGRFEKEIQFNVRELGKHGFNEIFGTLFESFPISSVIFGTTEWRSLIKITKLSAQRSKNYPYYLGKLLFNQYKHNGKTSSWYFPKGFYGVLNLIFSVRDEILEDIFLPLMTFMHKFGFWGGKWNLGFGRLKVKSLEISKEYSKWERDTFKIGNKEISIKDFFQEVTSFNDLTTTSKKLKLLKTNFETTDKKEIIKNLIKMKLKERKDFRSDTEVRHKIFGTTKPPPIKERLPQGSKILPFIGEGKTSGFISITGLLNLESLNESSN